MIWGEFLEILQSEKRLKSTLDQFFAQNGHFQAGNHEPENSRTSP